MILYFLRHAFFLFVVVVGWEMTVVDWSLKAFEHICLKIFIDISCLINICV